MGCHPLGENNLSGRIKLTWQNVLCTFNPLAEASHQFEWREFSFLFLCAFPTAGDKCKWVFGRDDDRTRAPLIDDDRNAITGPLSSYTREEMCFLLKARAKVIVNIGERCGTTPKKGSNFHIFQRVPSEYPHCRV